MNDLAISASRWSVSVRTHGDILAGTAQVPGFELALLSGPDGYNVSEIEGWLRDLIGVASESAAADSSERAIPALLEHALTGLLFTHAELWDARPEQQPCSAAFVRTEREVAFGWVGDAEVRVWIDGRASDPRWTRVRDDAGHEARALTFAPNRRIQVSLSWGHGADPSTLPAASIDAEWSLSHARETSAAVGSVQQAAEPTRAVAPPAAPPRARLDNAPPVAEPASGPSERPGGRDPWHFRSWVTGLASQASHDADADLVAHRREPADTSSADSDLVPPTPEPRELTARTAPLPAEAPEFPRAERLGAPTPAAPPPHARDTAIPTFIPSSARPAPRPAPAPTESLPTNVARSAHEQTSEALPTPQDTPFADDAHTRLGSSQWGPEPSAESFESAPVLDAPDRARAIEAPIEPWEELPEPVTDVVPDAIETAAPGVDAMSSIDEPMPPALEESPSLATRHGAVESTPRRPRVRAEWPEALDHEPAPPRRLPLHLWPWVAGVLALFVIGWLIGRVPSRRDAATAGSTGVAAWMDRVGLGAPHFQVAVSSTPPGAWIAVDGHELSLRTPATIQVAPGAHQVGLSFPGLGGITQGVRGERNARATVDATLWGALTVNPPADGTPVSVTVDGEAKGQAPLALDRLAPGVHQLQFGATGVEPWAQTVEVHVNQTAEVIAQPIRSPATGLLEVRATSAVDGGDKLLPGANVWIDGVPRGVTPLRVELPRGPHSLRIESQGLESPVQVVDLPGGNQRFVSFDLGADSGRPRLALLAPVQSVSPARPSVVSAAIDGLTSTDLRDMWLHVSTADGAWKRYQMMVLKAPEGVVGVTLFPATALDAQGTARFYVSASSNVGDEYFTEMQTALAEGATPVWHPRRRGARSAGSATPAPVPQP